MIKVGQVWKPKKNTPQVCLSSCGIVLKYEEKECGDGTYYMVVSLYNVPRIREAWNEEWGLMAFLTHWEPV